MKIAYISTYRDGTLAGHAATQYILACEAAGLDVVCRPVSMGTIPQDQKPCPVAHLEQKNMQGVDVVIQHVLPQFYQYKRGVKNIGFLEWSTSDFNRSLWTANCNLMDEIYTSCEQNREAAFRSGVTKPIRVIPRPCDILKFEQEYKPLDIGQTQGKLVFYSITSLTRNTNISGLIRAYYREFSARDDVVLVLCVQSEGKSEQDISTSLQKAIGDIKKSTHIYKNAKHYPPILLIAQQLSPEETSRIHATCDIFVSAARGCVWSNAAHNALGFGNPIIVSQCGGFIDLLGKGSGGGWFVDGQTTPCFGMSETTNYLYTGEEVWFDPNLIRLSEHMGMAYQMWKRDPNGTLKAMGKNAKKRAQEFSYTNVGNIIRKLLDD